MTGTNEGPSLSERIARANATMRPLVGPGTLHGMVQAQAAKSPDAIAVVVGAGTLSYAQLDAQANRLAQALRARGVQPGDLVAVCLDRGLDLMPALLGVLKSGAAYVPLDPGFPAQRVAAMLADAQATAVVTHSSLSALLGGADAPLLCIDTDAAEIASQPADAPEIVPGALAYVIYTSGSTGKPKGVEVLHRGVCNLMTSMAREPGCGAQDRMLALATVSFDMAVPEIWLPLLCGARTVLLPREQAGDGVAIEAMLREHQITWMQATPTTAFLLLDAGWQPAPGFKLIVGAEPVPAVLRDRLLATGVSLWNFYGPTETTVWSTCTRLLAPGGRVSIGVPMDNTTVWIVDEALQAVAPGETGEICIGGAGVAAGYRGLAELTAERFVPDPFHATPGARIYRTGDLGRWREDGELEHLGRMDHQVKVRGYRIELGDIEACLAQDPAVGRVVAMVREDEPGDQRIVAYLVAAAGATLDAPALLQRAKASLPEYMVPQHLVPLSSLPFLPNGKINRAALPAPSSERPALAGPCVAPQGALEQAVCQAFEQVLRVAPIGREDQFFDLGGTSVLVLKVLAQLRAAGYPELGIPAFFDAPTPAGIARALAALAAPPVPLAAAPRRTRARPADDGAIAIIGMAGRFPGADSVEAFWDNLIAGRDSISRFALDTLDPSLPAALVRDADYVAARGVIEGVEQFDAAFFGIGPKEAALLDPQQRVFLEACWTCMESSGYVADTPEASMGVFAGVYAPSYLIKHLMSRPELVEQQGELPLLFANDKDYVASRVSHRLNLHGPAIAVHTACSTSLVAVVQAVDALRAGRCDMALAGGASVTNPPRSGYLYQAGGMLSQDGRTRAFADGATGTVFSDGVGVVMLKRLADAQAAGDTIHAVIRGAAVNNDGGEKASFTAPSVSGQVAVIRAALADGDIDARSVGYVEAHGTGTPMGDPIEVEALTRAYRADTADSGYCRLGSVKSNIGHLVTAAGVTGLIKSALALERAELPASLHVDTLNPAINFAASPFEVLRERTPWPRSANPRRAGVSSFGVGGTNAHVVLEEAPLPTPRTEPATGVQLLRLSARTATALEALSRNLAEHLDAHPSTELVDVSATLRLGRRPMQHRLAIVAADVAAARAALRDASSPARARGERPAQSAEVVFVFPGQGAQYAGMGAGLCASSPVFRAAFDACLVALPGDEGSRLKAQVFGDDDSALRDTAVTQPATFALEYALAQTWLAAGLRPSALIGHSVGEFVAAVLAGVMPLADAVRLVARRGALLQALPGGAMLSARLDRAALEACLPATLDLATHNGPTACVVAGPADDIEAFRLALEADGVVARLLQTSHAFHSRMMDAAVTPFEAAVRKLPLQAPLIPIVSTVTGQWMKDSEARDAGYWARHLRERVNFADAVAFALRELAAPLFLEVGPRNTLVTLVRQQRTAQGHIPRAVASLSDAREREAASLALAAGQLWTLGVDVSTDVIAPDRAGRRIPLPGTVFERQRFWIEAPLAHPAAGSAAAAAATSTASLLLTAPTQAPTHTSAPAPATSAQFAPAAVPAPVLQPAPVSTIASGIVSMPATPALLTRVQTLLEDVSGFDVAASPADTTFLELGLDSLTLSQVAMQLKREFKVEVTFRQLMETFRSTEGLVAHLQKVLPPEVAAPATTVAPAAVAAMPQAVALPAALPAMAMPVASSLTLDPAAANGNAVTQLIAQQLQVMAQQLAALTGAHAASAQPVLAQGTAPAAPAAPAAPTAEAPAAAAAAPAQTAAPLAAAEEQRVDFKTYDVKKAFGAIARIHTRTDTTLSERQQARLQAFMARYIQKTRKSREYTEEHRPHLADPRVVNGFRPVTKEITYQITVEKSKGALVWDLDGNEYVDAINGFGMGFFGWQPDFVVDAIKRQIDAGFEIGPQHPLAGEVAKLICEMTGFDRAGLCNTGSEAVMGCVRVARTVTGRPLIVTFSNSYHGIFDEVIIRGNRKHRAVPAAPGILPESVSNVIVLEYGSPEALQIIRDNADDIAAVLVEPVQSRRPEFQPKEFLKSLRALTTEIGSVLIFDEVITGFRVGPGGAQAHFGVKADIASYGKVIGGGFPIGVIAGKREFMDALDGGHWNYGDDSMPTVGVTYFAGTFVRHPLALAAAHACLAFLKAQGPSLQTALNTRTAALVDELNAYCREVGAPVEIRHFSSLWRIVFTEDHPLQDLLFAMMRERGVHLLDNFPCYMTIAHGNAEIARIKQAFKEAMAEMQASEFLPKRVTAQSVALDASKPPVPGARLGRDTDGKPAWFIPNPAAPGKFVKVEA